MPAPTSMSAGAEGAFGISAGLQVVSGVFGYLTALNAQSIANSRAQMMRNEADANAQRYAEQAQADNAQRKVMFLASGVTLSGSPIDVLDKQAQIAGENIAAIRRNGEIEAFDEEQRGDAALVQGRNALLGGFAGGVRTAATPAIINSGNNQSAMMLAALNGVTH